MGIIKVAYKGKYLNSVGKYHMYLIRKAIVMNGIGDDS
jgi:hypothetical protein